jgi:hypothetical protein
VGGLGKQVVIWCSGARTAPAPRVHRPRHRPPVKGRITPGCRHRTILSKGRHSRQPAMFTGRPPTRSVTVTGRSLDRACTKRRVRISSRSRPECLGPRAETLMAMCCFARKNGAHIGKMELCQLSASWSAVGRAGNGGPALAVSARTPSATRPDARPDHRVLMRSAHHMAVLLRRSHVWASARPGLPPSRRATWVRYLAWNAPEAWTAIRWRQAADCSCAVRVVGW